MAFIRKFKTTSGATGVQVCYKEQGRVVRTEHIGSASTESGVEKLVIKAQALIDEGKNPLFNLDKYNKKKG
ncbi:hypothetical protein IJI89_03410 [Candidatus Saccharibacteria bacterium]|nr:hypothetical protein [Candidatus Saccharibacteria bacterium]